MKPQGRQLTQPPGARVAFNSAAFSLIEMIGVLAVIAVLAAAILPSFIKRIDLRTRAQEVARLGDLSDALTQWALRNKSIPAISTWSNAASAGGSMSVSQAAANARRFARTYYPQSDPYSQTVEGLSSHPANCRALVVSVLGGDALDPGVNCPVPGASMAPEDFQHLWDLADGTLPTRNPWPNWKGKADDLLVQRLDYAPLFHHLILVNRDAALIPQFTIDDSAGQPLPQSPGRSRYYIDGTVIGLCTPGGVVTNRYVLKRDISFVFEKGVWRSKIAGVPMDDPTANDFALQAQLFLDADWNSDAFKGSNQQGIITAMYTFMLTYTFWANRYPHFTTSTTIQQVPEYIILRSLGDPQGHLDVFSDRLIRDH